MECYRRLITQGTWERAPLWERRALERYQEIQQDRRMKRIGPVLICTSRPDGSVFMAHLQEKTAGIYSYVEEGCGAEVEMMWAPVRPSGV
jgi:hypothetical protein